MGEAYEAVADSATRAVRDCELPTIAAVSGYAMGGGCGLALACDFRIGDSSARIGIPAARLGIVYGPLDCSLLLRQVGLANAKRVLYSGRAFDLDDCRRMGLVDMPAEQGSALEAAHAFAADLSNNAPLSIRGAKLVLDALATGTADTRAGEIDAFIARAMDSADYKEGAAAFAAKRPPRFVGR
jgi:enoyl-CoA hydratase/carnithine racemase